MAVNKSVQLGKAKDEDIEDIDFAAMLEESFKRLKKIVTQRSSVSMVMRF